MSFSHAWWGKRMRSAVPAAQKMHGSKSVSAYMCGALCAKLEAHAHFPILPAPWRPLMPHHFHVTKLGAVRRSLLAGLVLLIAISLVSTTLDLVHRKREHEQQARLASRNMAQALDQSITGSVEKINIVLQSSVDFLEERLRRNALLASRDVNAYFQQQQARVPELMSIRASDAKGLVRFGPDVNPGDLASWVNRDFWGPHKSKSQLGLVVSNPVVGKVSGHWIIALVRRYNHPDGSFAGVVAAGISVDYFETLLSSMELGSYGTAVLRDSNRALIARFPRVDGPSGVVGSKGFSKELAQAMDSGEKVVTYHAVNTSDGVERINTYRRLSTVPFHLLAGNGAKDYLADFGREVAFALTQFLLYALVVSAGTWFLWRAIRHNALEHARSSALLRGASDGIHVLDSQGNLVEASDSFFAMLGYGRAEGMGLNVQDWDADFPMADLQLLVPGRFAQTQTTVLAQHRRKDGSAFAVEVNVLPVDMHGRTLLFNSSRDITLRKQAEAELQQSHAALSALNASLEARVTARTQELQAALQIAEAAIRSRADFLANTSHEIRTPMNSVLGMAYLALRTTSDPQQRAYLEKIQRSSAYLMRILDDILDFSKMEAGKLALEITRFDLDLTLAQLMHWNEDHARDKDLSLRLDCADDVPRLLMGDPLRLKQVLLNFVSNAIKFTERGSVEVRLSCLERSAQDCLLCFEVQDTGIGLRQEECQRLFQSFEQADKSITRRFGGTGLGLAICRQLAHLMGGEVGVNSELARGSTFWLKVRFPLVQAQQAETMRANALRPAGAGLQGLSILVVDDNAFNLEVAKGLLESVGVAVQTAADGAQAIALLRAHSFDGVLMDVQMPVMDGLQATRLLRADAQLANTLVIAVTANASAADYARCLGAGMNDVIGKPVEPEKMFHLLSAHVQAQRLRSGLVTPPTVPPSAVAAPAAPAQWDRLVQKAYIGSQPGQQQKLLAIFLQSAVQSVLAAQQAVAAEDWNAAAAAGHKLKSAARYVGAMQLASLCEALERTGKRGDANGCRQLQAQVQTAFAAVQALMQAALASLD